MSPSEAPASAAVVIVGGGCVGASIAFHLARSGLRDVVLLEKETFLGAGSTGKCAGGVRAQFSRPANIRLSLASIDALRRFPDETGVDPQFRQVGYLFLLTTAGEYEAFEESAARQRALGVPVETWSPSELARRVPEVRAELFAGATFCPIDGLANAHAVTQGYAVAARRLGVRIFERTAAIGIDVTGSQVRAVRTSRGEIATRTVVNAAGPHARTIGDMAGVSVPVTPLMREYFTTGPLSWVPDWLPMIIDFHTGFYCHKEAGGMLLGMADPQQAPGFDESVNWDFLPEIIERAVAVVPRLGEAQIHAGTAGLYEVSPDCNPILGFAPEVRGFVCANGFSGHGFMHSPAVGAALAELMAEGESRSIDLTPFSPARFASGILVREQNVV